MNRVLLRFAILAAPLSVTQIGPQAQAAPARKAAARKAAAPLSVVDYFKRLPLRYTRVPASALLQNGPAVDLANNYIEATARDSSVTVIASLLRHNGRVLVAVYSEHERFSFDLLRLENGRWQNVTRVLIPRLSKGNVYLPERGEPVVHVFEGEQGEVIYEKGRFLYDLAWRNGKFSIQN